MSENTSGLSDTQERIADTHEKVDDTQAGAFLGESTPTRLDLPLTALAILYWAFILSYALWLWMPRARYAVVFVGGSMLVFITNEASKALARDERTDLAILSIAAILTVATVGYVAVYFWQLFYIRPGVGYPHEYALAVALILTVMYLSYRSFGLAFVFVAVLALLYGLGGGYIPGLFGHSGLRPIRMLNIMVLNVGGFFGSISRIIAAWVALFLLYTGLVQAYGAFELILRGVVIAAVRFRSGVAQFAVLASMVIGSINGSPSANAAMTGSFTIPMMKDSGLPSEIAAGVEASASSGGQVMPPVMGAAAFVMASLLGITYFDVLIAGLIPAFIFVITVAVGVHYATLRNTPEGLSPKIDWEAEEFRSGGELAWDALKFLLPFCVLVYTLGVLQWTVVTSAMMTVFAQLLTGFSFPIVESLYDEHSGEDLTAVLRETLAETIDGARFGAIILAPIGIIIALINGIVDIIRASGLPGSLTLAMMNLTGGSLLFAAIVAMVICILLGMGMPSVAAYTVVAILVAPTFIQAFLVPGLAAHYFVFYSAILSFITPPIATAAVVASGVAGANFWRTCLAAIRISIVLFVLPIVFLFNPILLVGGFTLQTFLVTGVVLLGGVSITHGVNYAGVWAPNRALDVAIRLVYVGLGLVIMIYPDLVVSVGAVTVVLVMFFVQYGALLRGGITRLARRVTS